MQFRYAVYDTNNGDVDPNAPVLCERETFLATAENMVGPAGPAGSKGCLCQTAPTKYPPPTKCADEGQACECKGTVFFGKAMPAANDSSSVTSLSGTFEDFIAEPYALKRHVNGMVACMSDEFTAEYDFGSTSSSCFCDSIGYYEDEAIQRDVDFFTAEYR